LFSQKVRIILSCGRVFGANGTARARLFLSQMDKKMSFTLLLPSTIMSKLQKKAKKESASIEEIALKLLASALEEEESSSALNEVVEKIRTTNRKNEMYLSRSSHSLAEALRETPQASTLDVAAWEEDWAKVEAEMRDMADENDRAEGRG
jgi:hypothetical protein